jgi:hypothetical protein
MGGIISGRGGSRLTGKWGGMAVTISQRKMRRKDKEISDPREVEAILKEALTLHLGLCLGDEPYLHGGVGGTKFELMAANPRVSFSVVTGVETIPHPEPCEWSVRYRSVVGFGTARFLETPEEKNRGLNALTAHLGAGTHTYSPELLARVVVVEIDVTQATGRQSGYP